ncbi:MAG: hypothetical protein ACXQTI_01795 [Candidatus Nezhaarchaeales archaeon]
MGRVIGRGLEAIREFIRRCLGAGGVPIFRTKYGGKRLPGNTVIAACWGAGDKVKGGMITDVPPDIITEMEKRVGDWKWLAERLGVTY